MLTSKYHIGTLIAIFLALGIGILLGGTLGQNWVVHTEDHIVEMLMNRYEQQLSMNQMLQKQLTSLQLMNRTNDPILRDQHIVWIRPEHIQSELLAFIIKSAGANWMEQNIETAASFMESAFDPLSAPDIILITDPEDRLLTSDQIQLWNRSMRKMKSKVVDVEPAALQFRKPQEAVDFIMYLKKIIEEESHAAFGFYRYSGME